MSWVAAGSNPVTSTGRATRSVFAGSAQVAAYQGKVEDANATMTTTLQTRPPASASDDRMLGLRRNSNEGLSIAPLQCAHEARSRYAIIPRSNTEAAKGVPR
jgi:hypothetical protein